MLLSVVQFSIIVSEWTSGVQILLQKWFKNTIKIKITALKILNKSF